MPDKIPPTGNQPPVAPPPDSPPSNSETTNPPLPKKSGGMDQLKEWLGPENYKKFINMWIKTIGDQIHKDQEKAKEAIRKAGKISRGEDPDD